jgi:hypothetical protein
MGRALPATGVVYCQKLFEDGILKLLVPHLSLGKNNYVGKH